MTSNSTASFFGEAVPSLKFGKIGDKVAGKVIDKEVRQQMDDKSPDGLAWWPDGRPKMQVVLTLECSEYTEDDDGLRRLFIRGYMQQSFRDACKKARIRDITNGMYVAVERTGTAEPKRRGFSGAFLFVAEVSQTPIDYALVQSIDDEGSPDSHEEPPF